MKTERRAAGAVLVELVLALPLFLVVMYGLLECARLVYLWNTLQAVTRAAVRAAAVTDYNDAAAMEQLRQRALLRAGAGALAMGAPVDGSYLRIEYLWQDAAGALQPVAQGARAPCPALNLLYCLRNPNGSDCIRFVRARICSPADAASCQPVPFQPLLPPLPRMDWQGLALPPSDSTARAGALGYQPGSALCAAPAPPPP
ncbi:TadE family protein [Pseudoduganella aquatica]|uniref:Pilus assembly protein n=1 Tax=Pseudoduganella aquatica TaxID=2660641 RepID=A0A7X4KPI5_9BURK|nr:TadE family protein [Pseudoduganella aquatica]MYN10318.1 pilus assembly protein [Pseudoduganella aquatica]